MYEYELEEVKDDDETNSSVKCQYVDETITEESSIAEDSKTTSGES